MKSVSRFARIAAWLLCTLGICAWPALATSPQDPDVWRVYSAPGGLVTVVLGETGDKLPAAAGTAPRVLAFRDSTGVLIQVFSDHPVDRGYVEKLVVHGRADQRERAEHRHRHDASRGASDDGDAD